MLKHLRECTHCPTEAKQLADPDKAANQSGNDQQLEKQGRMQQSRKPQLKKEAGEFIVSQSQPSASSSSQGQVDDDNLDLDTLTSADEFEAEVNEWMNELALEAASSDDSVPLMETPAIQKAKLSSIFGSALQPLSNEDLLANY